MSNNITIVGRLGRDAERKTAGNSTVLEFSVAEDVGFGDKKVTNWWKCAYWGKPAEGALGDLLVKGTQVVVFGEVTQRKYSSASGDGISLDIRVNNVQLVGSKAESPAQAQQRPASPPAQSSYAPQDIDDDLPF